jgi:transmembrane sensor
VILVDGSLVELNTGATIDVQFTPENRTVRLVRGEAHFVVAKKPDRPFVVLAEQIAVRAVGTAFSVSMGQSDFTVLVTEGRVSVDDTHRDPGSNADDTGAKSSALVAGQRATIKGETRTFVVQDLTPAELERALSWQGMRLEFVELPLAEIVKEFNRYNRKKLVIGDPEIEGLVIAGSFRADNVDGFVRLLGSSFGISHTRYQDEIVLRKAW